MLLKSLYSLYTFLLQNKKSQESHGKVQWCGAKITKYEYKLHTRYIACRSCKFRALRILMVFENTEKPWEEISRMCLYQQQHRSRENVFSEIVRTCLFHGALNLNIDSMKRHLICAHYIRPLLLSAKSRSRKSHSAAILPLICEIMHRWFSCKLRPIMQRGYRK